MYSYYYKSQRKLSSLSMFPINGMDWVLERYIIQELVIIINNISVVSEIPELPKFSCLLKKGWLTPSTH
jgi:hypothetical protein